MVSAHPTDDVLAEYASGALDAGMSLLVASHLTFCPECRRAIAAEEAIGGALLAAEPPAPHAPCIDAIFARIAGAEQAAALVDDADSPLPCPLRLAVGTRFSAIPWRARLPGLAEHVIADERGASGLAVRVSLVRARPGVRIPEHTHGGDEMTLILCGAMEDGGAVYRKGDVSCSDDRHEHQPRILDEGVCVCLLVLNGGLRFTGPFGRALNLLM